MTEAMTTLILTFCLVLAFGVPISIIICCFQKEKWDNIYRYKSNIGRDRQFKRLLAEINTNCKTADDLAQVILDLYKMFNVPFASINDGFTEQKLRNRWADFKERREKEPDLRFDIDSYVKNLKFKIKMNDERHRIHPGYEKMIDFYQRFRISIMVVKKYGFSLSSEEIANQCKEFEHLKRPMKDKRKYPWDKDIHLPQATVHLPIEKVDFYV